MTTIIPPRRGEFFTPGGIPTQRFMEYLEALSRQTNTNTETSVTGTVQSLYGANTGDSDGILSAMISSLYSAVVGMPQFSAVTATSDYTADAYDFVNAKNRIEVKFPQYPGENDVVIIRNGDGTRIDLNGNGKNINGQSSGEINLEGTALTFQYFIDTDEWFAR